MFVDTREINQVSIKESNPESGAKNRGVEMKLCGGKRASVSFSLSMAFFFCVSY